MNQAFECHVNWRLVHQGFEKPSRYIAFDNCDFTRAINGLVLFLPQNCGVNVIEMRDWLHNIENNSSGYQMIGCYSYKSQKFTFQGLKLVFPHPHDAVMFRLAWIEAVCDTAQHAEYS